MTVFVYSYTKNKILTECLIPQDMTHLQCFSEFIDTAIIHNYVEQYGRSVFRDVSEITGNSALIPSQNSFNGFLKFKSATPRAIFLNQGF